MVDQVPSVKSTDGGYQSAIGVMLVDKTGTYAPSGGVTSLPSGTDRSGSITTGGAAQDVAAANALRVGMTFQNTSDTVMRLTESGTDASATNGYSIAAGQAVNVSTNKRISLFCATAGKTFAATEY